MSHTAALYKVRVRKKYARKDAQSRLLGDMDEAGTSLLFALDHLMQGFEAHNGDGSKAVICESCRIEGNELVLMLRHGETGVVADIADASGEPQYHQRIDDTQWVRCGCLFRLPPHEQTGAFVVHVNNNRGVKGILARGIEERLRDAFPDVSLDILPVVSASAFNEAVDHDRIDRVTLTRYERPQDRFVNDTTKWVRANEIGKLELKITAVRKGQRIIADLIRRFREDKSAFSDIVEFAGIQFETAKVEVVLPDNTRRTFNIERPDAGHPITEELTELDLDDRDEPTESSLFAGLRLAADDVADSD